MSYETRLTGPRQAATEFGRALLAGIGMDISPVTSRQQGKKRKRLGEDTYYRTGPTMAPKRNLFNTKARATKFRRNLGDKTGKNATRREHSWGNENDLRDKRFRSFMLISAAHSSDESKINSRRGTRINCVGVKVNMMFSLQHLPLASKSHESPICIRWCILNPKENDGLPIATANPLDFFIEPDPVDKQVAPFPIEGTGLAYHKRKINREKWGVLKEGNFILSSSGNHNATTNIVDKRGCNQLSVWVPVNRQMKFNDPVSGTKPTTPTENLYFAYWYTRLGDTSNNQKYDSTSNREIPMHVHREQITYFRNSKMYA